MRILEKYASQILLVLNMAFFLLAIACVACFFIFPYSRWIYIACGFTAFGVRIITAFIRRRINH